MKIISGTIKGSKIEGFNIEGTRPTMDRVKESLFAMINPYLENSVCLDLFAGSGNLGFESISNGSKYCYFNDRNIKCIDVIKRNVKQFKLQDMTKILNLDYRKCLEYLKNNNIVFDIIFLDPPYENECLNEVIDYILKNNMLNDEGIIVCEVNKNYLNEEWSGLDIIKNRKYGDKLIIIYKKTSH